MEQVLERVERGEARSVRALVQLGYGTLAVRGGAEALMEGQFEFSDAAWRPEVSYDVADGVGKLVVKQPEDLKSFASNKGKAAWDVAFGDETPLELALRLGSGDADVALAGTHALLLEVAVGSGQVQADCSGATDLRNVAVKTGSGRVDLKFGGEYAHLSNVEVNVASGVSDLVLNGAYPSLKSLKVNGASGRIALHIAGACPALRTVALNTASGVVDLSFAGALPEELEVGIHCVSGVATVRVAEGQAVSARFSSVSGKVKAPGFRKENGRYVNDTYDAARPALRLAMSTVSGELVLQPAES